MKVLIVGGGMAGLTTASSLRSFNKHVEIIVVLDPKEYLEIHSASVRTSTGTFDSNVATTNSTTFDIQKWAVSKSIKVIKGSVVKLTSTDATLSDGNVLEFNTSVVCTGARRKFPAFPTAIFQELVHHHVSVQT